MSQADAKKTVLLVDDAPANIQVVNSILKDIYKIRIATNGSKALELAKADPPPDLVLLDVMMPGVDGIDVLSQLKKLNASIPVIILSGVDQVKTVVEAIRLGASDYLSKPFEPEELLHAVARCAERYRLLEENALLRARSAVGKLREEAEGMS
jgi:DNA-binding NtrC family response regulator